MTVMSIGMIMFLVLFVAVLMVDVLIGVFVYRDAKRRNMNALLWTLVALLAPGFVGIIIYLVVRTGYSDNQCGQCGSNVKEDYQICPNCGASLKEHCGNCNYPLEAGWSKCPSCGTEIPEGQRAKILPKKNDNGILKVILIFVLAGIVGIVGGVVLLYAVFCANFVSEGDTEYYHEEVNVIENIMGNYDTHDIVTNGYINREEIENWMDECDKTGKGMYVLKAKGEGYIEYLVYNNDSYTCVEISGDETYADFHYVEVASGDYEMNYAFFKGSSDLKLKIYKDGRSVDYKISEIDTLKIDIENLE